MKISLIVSLVSLVFAAIDRYFAIAFPSKYRKTNTIKTAKVLSIITWILSALVTIIINSNILGDFESITYFLQPFTCENQIYEAVFIFVLFFLLWMFTLLTLKSLYKSYKRSSKLYRAVRSKFKGEKQMPLVLTFMVAAFTLSLSTTLLFYFMLEKVLLVATTKILDSMNIFLNILCQQTQFGIF